VTFKMFLNRSTIGQMLTVRRLIEGVKAKTLQACQRVDLYVNALKTEHINFNQQGSIR